MDIDEEIEKIEIWAFVEHNRSQLCTLRGLKYLKLQDFDGYFLDVWKDQISQRISSLRERVDYFLSRIKTSKRFSRNRKRAFIIRSAIAEARVLILEDINAMSIYAWDQDALGPIT